jgi:hypothetical protein
MLGRYNAGGMGLNVQEVIGTTAATQKTIEEILPTVELIATDYQRVSPGVNFIADYWYTVLMALFLSSALGATFGSWFVLRKLKK